MARITIVLSTYNRPALLRWTIKSILDQTVQDWILLVIGDSCAPETGKVVRSFKDDRIFYLNLGDRCGEQSGPNSAGFYAAETEFVAFVNHDDLWLPDHLERALAVLEADNAEFYCSAAAFTGIDDSGGGKRMYFNAVSPKGRSVEEGMLQSPAYFEPVSTWVMRQDLIRKVGAWMPAATIYRTPLEDWILRAWRADTKIHFDGTVTVLYCTGGARNSAAQGVRDYDAEDDECKYWYSAIREQGASAVRKQVDADTNGGQLGRDRFKNTYRNNPASHVFEALQNDQTVKLYKEFGWDGFDVACHLIRRKPGFRLRRMLKRRTGEELPEQQNWQGIARAVKVALQKKNRWRKKNGHE